MSYTERDLTSRFSKWLREQRRDHDNFKFSAAFELKVCKKPSLGLYDFQPQQLPALRRAKHKDKRGVYKKISDLDINRCPFDSFLLYNVNAYIVVEFYKKHTTHEIIMIDIDDFDSWFENHDRKSIPKDEAERIGDAYKI